jgi:outer membrane lipoprotein-sorting protein
MCKAMWLLAFAALASAQPSADEILRQARLAMGGTKLAAVESLSVSGEAVNNGSITSDVTLSIQLPDKFLREQTVQLAASMGAGISPEMAAQVGSPTVVDCLNGDEQWSDIRMSADSQIESAMIERAAGSMLSSRRQDLRGTFTRYLLALLLADRPSFPMQFAVVDQTPTPDGGTAYALEGKGPGDFAIRLFIDSKTYLPMMMAHVSGDTVTQIWLSKYKAEDGVNMPHLMSWMQGNRETERLEIKKVKINPKFPPGKFVKGGK